jgi:uncharacterized repeat protein (TIGR03806 family)
MSRKCFFGATVLALAAALTACSNSGGSTANAPPAPTPPDTTAPTVPQGTAAVAQSSTSILVSWSASTDSGTGVAGYRVFRNAGATAVATVTTLNYTDTGLTASTVYSYTVQAFDGATPANVSAASAGATATTMAVPPPSPTSGLDSRPSNTTCLAGDRPSGAVTIAVQRVFPSLSFSTPIAMLQAPGDSARWFVVEQSGVVRTFANQANASASTVFGNIASRVLSGGEQGLLGMAFHPNFPANPRVYLSYTAQPSGTSRISEFRSTDGGATLDAATEVILLTVPQPASNHNGGNIVFGADGFLYIGFGDGGNGGDPFGTIGNGQNLLTLLGKMLRIDIAGPTGAVPYRIPSSNPYAANALCNGGSGAASCPEIYAYGLRNPWRWSFDRGTNELWLADVGQNQWEEVDRITLGGNYGWRCREGAHAFNSACGPNAGSAIDPVAEYNHTVGQSITGGYVYRGTAIPALVGRYVFADFVSGRVWHIARDTAPTLQVTSGFDSNLSVAAFGEDQSGELYVVDYSGGLYRIVAGSASGATIPTLLSATGCVNPSNTTQPASGLIPYQPNAAFWSDGASKQRHIALPNGQQIVVGTDNDFTFPNGSVLVKNFLLGTRLVETRLFMRHNDGVWAGYTYEWNAQGTDATRVIGGKTAQVAGQSWIFPSEAQCLSCHTAAAGHSLGLEIAQLNGNFQYALTGRTANQLVTLNTIGTLTPALTQTPSQLPALPDPYGASGTLSERARAYLHTNCANCHRPGGGTPSSMDLRYMTTLMATNACDALPQAGTLGITSARLIAPGDAARSVLVARANRRDSNAMPPLSSTVIDTAGVALLSNWVNSLASCN